MDFKEIDVNMRNWVDLGQDRDYWSVLLAHINSKSAVASYSFNPIGSHIINLCIEVYIKQGN